MTPLEMARAFFEHTGRRGTFNETSVNAMLEWLDEHGILIVSDTGMIGGMVIPLWVTGEMVAQEMFWWGDASLLTQFETRAREMGATAIQMNCLTDRVGEHYDLRGYVKILSTWVKEF